MFASIDTASSHGIIVNNLTWRIKPAPDLKPEAIIVRFYYVKEFLTIKIINLTVNFMTFIIIITFLALGLILNKVKSKLHIMPLPKSTVQP